MLAMDLISKWAPMDVEDALELLGPSFRHPGVRQYAVNRLHKSPDEDLQLYLLQLVQVKNITTNHPETRFKILLKISTYSELMSPDNLCESSIIQVQCNPIGKNPSSQARNLAFFHLIDGY